jgi:hypothetical protein
MKVVFHEDFYQVYTSDPASAGGRMEAIVDAIKSHVVFIIAEPASEADVCRDFAHTQSEFNPCSTIRPLSDFRSGCRWKQSWAATIALSEPRFRADPSSRPHAPPLLCGVSAIFNNMAIALEVLKAAKNII